VDLDGRQDDQQEARTRMMVCILPEKLYCTRTAIPGPSDSRHASKRAGTLQLSCNGIILNDFRIKNADAGAE
jgi:hypothetical protein